MKSFKIYILLCFTSLTMYGQTFTIPDNAFKVFLKKNQPQTLNAKEELIILEAKKVTGKINCSGSFITDLDGLQFFSSINTLEANNNLLVTIPSISTLTNLETLNLKFNSLTALPDISPLQKLTVLIVNNNKLQSIADLSRNTSLEQIIAFNNSIVKLHGISKLINLKKLDISYNKLSSIPDLSSLINLNFLDASHNRLTVTPDVIKNKKLKTILLHQNLLTTSLNVLGLDSLSDVQLQNNQLSFRNFLNYISIPNYTSIFILHPQKSFPADTVQVGMGKILLLQTNIDTMVTGVIYNWYFKGSLLKTVNNDSLQIENASMLHEGKYVCKIQHKDFPGKELFTDTFLVKIITCTSGTMPTFKVLSEINCMQTGTIEIITNSNDNMYTFELVSPETFVKTYTSNNKFQGLTEPNYNLKITSTACNENYTLPVAIPYNECLEALLTPNNDGDRDQYFFSKSGKVKIYDKSGIIVHSLNIPSNWNGVAKDGKNVNPGYYLAEINDGEEFIMISIVY